MDRGRSLPPCLQIKPANIFLHKGDELKLGDLGLSKMSQAATRALAHTVCGSPIYAAPEIHMGQPYSKSVDVCESQVEDCCIAANPVVLIVSGAAYLRLAGAVGCTLFDTMMLEHAFQVSARNACDLWQAALCM